MAEFAPPAGALRGGPVSLWTNTRPAVEHRIAIGS
jgi:hypothetical protein